MRWQRCSPRRREKPQDAQRTADLPNADITPGSPRLGHFLPLRRRYAVRAFVRLSPVIYNAYHHHISEEMAGPSAKAVKSRRHGWIVG